MGAAKHIDTLELAVVVIKMCGGLFRFLEVTGHAGEAVMPEIYYRVADITEFNYPIELATYFRDAGSLQYLSTFGESVGLMPNDLGITFTENQDTQPGHADKAAPMHMSRAVYNLANIFRLLHPCGTPQIKQRRRWEAWPKLTGSSPR